MDVFLVPVGASHHELYTELSDPPLHAGEVPHQGLFRSWAHRFREMLATAERERASRMGGGHVDEPRGWWGRVKGRTLRWAAETIAEQRLLWHLRRCAHATLHYPDDLPETAARDALMAQLSSDLDKHRRWLIIDSLGFVASGVFFFVPGPNLIAYYFAFRLVGHFLSMRGARQGLNVTEWHYHASDALREIRHVVTNGAPDRDARLRRIQASLRLEHLASFVGRVCAAGSP